MAVLEAKTEPTYTLTMNAQELRVIQALVGATTSTRLGADLSTVFNQPQPKTGDLPPEFDILGSLWKAVTPR